MQPSLTLLAATLALVLTGDAPAIRLRSNYNTGDPQTCSLAGDLETGTASYYADENHGRRTASGEQYDSYALTAAHRTLAFGTRVRVIHAESNRSVIVRINDRGPFVPGRIIDLSRAAAEELQITQTGLARVRLEVIP